ncbi:sulfurtransferase [Agromyces sp. MMS24-K17]|uniref:sulfurtransferase n=1 Tax=Agromyces sp. MMS24-K17 TaxID=3372850 RepID=UPI003754E1FD
MSAPAEATALEAAPTRADLLLDVDGLAALLASDEPPLLLDVRWRLDRPDGRPEYLAGHLPGAVYVDLDHELAEHDEDPRAGRHPLPSVEVLQAAARRWGLREGQSVVVYDDLKNLASSRAWWLLRHAGIADVRFLDGALRAWTAAGRPLETGEPPAPEPGDVTLEYGRLDLVGIDEVAALPETGTVVDARAAARYRGDEEPLDPRAGHIPGALNAPVTDVVDAEGRFRPDAELRAHFEAIGVRADAPVAAYCGSGITATAEVVALTLAGYEPVLYPGSWSQWSNHFDRPVATGTEIPA